MLLPPPLLLLLLLLPSPALLAPPTSTELQVRGERAPRDTKQDSIKVVISEGCATAGDSSDVSPGGKELDLVPGSPLVLTHRIKLVPSGPGSGSGSCGCEADLAALRERVENLEREVSGLRERCGGPEGNCCTSKESKGPGCSIKPEPGECPNECSDQGRCVDGRCVCFPGFSGPDCGDSNCPGNCNDRGRCVNGQCVCDPGSAGPDCSQTACPDGCGARGRCVGGRCVCDAGFSGPGCSDQSCPGDCNNRGRCVNGQCVCDEGHAGADCSEVACPGNCNNRGRCVNGQCVCDEGHAGADCSEAACPGNCNNRGRCVNGQCVCEPRFSGPDCSAKACPGNCSDRGRCVNGKCVCDSGFTGAGCSDVACPGNCNNRGRCVKGRCVCKEGFTGDDCSDQKCPGNCNGRGRCVNGECVCDSGFTGTDCAESSCPGNCNNRGRCVDGQCVCDDGFAGDDCSKDGCPGNCNNRGRCVNGQCVCDDGFAGDDCSKQSCPGNCNDRGRCVNGKCVCDSGFAGEDCSENSCPGNCNNRGRCVDGRCVCKEGFAGDDCSEKACPNNCSGRGRCVNGKCVCEVGFAGPDCAAKGCPGNCNGRGRCVKGSCVCRRGFTGPDCSQCQEGRTGANCDTVMSGVPQLTAQDITETSATLVWTKPAVPYDTYHITFSSQKDSDQLIPVQVEGGRTSFTQTGLAAGQEYGVTVVGEVDGRRGAESSTQFATLISGPSNLQVVKTTSSSAVVQWEESRAAIDRYILTVTPGDGKGRSQEITIPFGQNSAHVRQLEAGRLYHVVLVAERGGRQSQPASTQAVPGMTYPRVTMAALTLQVTQAPGVDREPNPQPVAQDESPGRPSGSGTPEVPGPLSSMRGGTPQGGSKRTEPDREPSSGTRSSESVQDKEAAAVPDADSDTNRRSGSKEHPDVGTAGRGNDSDPSAAAAPSQENKCLNRVTVTHLRLPPKARGSSRSNSAAPPPGDHDDSPDLLDKLLGDTYKNLNITTFSVHLSKASKLSSDEETKREQIIGGLKPLSSFFSDSSSSESTESPSSSAPPSQTPPTTEPPGSPENNTLNVENGKSGVDRKQPPPSGGAASHFRRTLPPKRGFVGHPNLNISVFQNRLHKVPHRTSPRLNPPPAASSDRVVGQEGREAAGVDPKPNYSLTGTDRAPVRRLPPQGGYRRSPSLNTGPLQNRTRPGARPFARPYRPSNPEQDARGRSPSATSPPSSSDSRLSNAGPIKDVDGRTISGRISMEVNETLSGEGTPPHRPFNQVGHFRRPQLIGGPFPNRTNLRYPHRGPIRGPGRKTVPTRKLNVGSRIGAGVPMSQPGTNAMTQNQPGGQDVLRPSEGVQIHQSREQDSAKAPSNTERDAQVPGPETNQFAAKDNQEIVTDVFQRKQILDQGDPRTSRPATPLRRPPPVTVGDHHTPTDLLHSDRQPQTDRSAEEETEGNIATSTDNQKGSDGPGTTVPDGPTPEQPRSGASRPVGPLTNTLEQGDTDRKTSTLKQTNSRPLKPVTPPKRPTPSRTETGQQQADRHHSRVRPETNALSTGSQETVQGHGPTGVPAVEHLPQVDHSSVRAEDGAMDTEGDEGSMTTNTDIQDRNTDVRVPGRPTPKQAGSRPLRPGTPLQRQPPARPAMGQHHTHTDGPETRPEKNTLDTGGNEESVSRGNVQAGGNTETRGRPASEGPGTKPSRPATPQKRIPPPRTRTGEHYGLQTRVRQESSSSDPAGQRVAGNTGSVIQGRPTSPRPSKRQPSAKTSTGTYSQDSGDRAGTEQLRQTDSEDVPSAGTSPQIVARGKSSGSAVGVRASRPGPVTSPKKPTLGLRHTPVRHPDSQRGGHPNTNHTTKKLSDSETAGSPASDVSSHGALREPLDYVGVTNRTSDGFTLFWDSPEGKYKNFVVTNKESEKALTQKERKRVSGDGEEPQRPERRDEDDENRVPEAADSSAGRAEPTGGGKTFKKEVPGSARSVQFQDLLPKTEYTLTLLGKGPGLLSRLHKLVISTGPEPPTNIVFSKVTDNSVTVSWTKPKSAVSGFKVTYTHAEEGEPVSVSVDSGESSVGLARLSPGSSYEVTVISTLGLDESDPISDAIVTLPDPPTDLRTLNVTDSAALLLWRPALAAVDEYAIVYGSGTGSELRVTVSGNAAEQQLGGLEASTTYTVTVSSLLGDLESSRASTSFTTSDGSGKDGDQVRDLRASDVTPRTATLSWKPPSRPVGRYRLTYQTEGQEMKEAMVDATATQYDLRRLFPGSEYSVQLQAEVGGQFTAAVSTEFTTGTLRFPFPSDCSQELLNGILTSGELEIFPQGKGGASTMVSCDMETDGGGWTVFQRRKDGSLDFFKGWKDYVRGFGDPNGEFWLGLESLHNLTTMTRMSLRVDLRSAGQTAFAQYSTFQVAKRNFKLTVGGYSGTAGDSLSYHNNRIFSTKDRDLSTSITRCAISYRGGWWYTNCHEANLNGLYGVTEGHKGVIWASWKGKDFSIPFTEMKMRPTAFRPPARG